MNPNTILPILAGNVMVGMNDSAPMNLYANMTFVYAKSIVRALNKELCNSKRNFSLCTSVNLFHIENGRLVKRKIEMKDVVLLIAENLQNPCDRLAILNLSMV